MISDTQVQVWKFFIWLTISDQSTS